MNNKGIVLATETECTGCSACYNACPTKSIKMVSSDEGFLYPLIMDTCVGCKKCENSCPIVNVNHNEIVKKRAYACINEDIDTRLKSSSGGVFALLAHHILKCGGVVFGAKFDVDTQSIIHTIIDKQENLDQIMRSKYAQSNIGKTFINVKKCLKNGKKVLFSGTPCQISGLQAFLGEKYDNLYLVDVICHGVPSNMLLEKYLKYISKENVTEMNFRDKKKGWTDFGMSIITDRQTKWYSKDKDPYMQMFLRNFCLRESCYSCKAKENDCADITLGDFWGIREVLPIIDDNNGTSLVITRTAKGEKLLESIIDNCKCVEVCYEDAVKHNRSEYSSTQRPIERNQFYKDLNQMFFKSMIKKYVPISWKEVIFSKLVELKIIKE